MRYHVPCLLLLSLWALAGCAGRIAEPVLSRDHPASPAAAEAPWTVAVPALRPEEQDKTRTGQSDSTHGEEHKTGGSAANPAVVYTCPMHPEIAQGASGHCPRCGMQLVERKRP